MIDGFDFNRAMGMGGGGVRKIKEFGYIISVCCIVLCICSYEYLCIDTQSGNQGCRWLMVLGGFWAPYLT